MLGVAATALTLGFSCNAWHVADPGQFLIQSRDTESLVVGRLAKSRQDGLLSAGGLTGLAADVDYELWFTEELAAQQISAYLDEAAVERFTPYLSQTGGQAMILGVLDRVLPLSPESTLRLFHAATSLLSALALALVVLWFLDEFGVLVAAVVLASALLSEWLTLFGRNLWWSMWAFYLPMVGVMYASRRGDPSSPGRTRLAAVAFALMSVKCFINGYEFITTTVLMMAVPLVYHDVVSRRTLMTIVQRLAAVFIGAGAATVGSLSVLSVQIASATGGNAVDGWTHIWYSFGKRTHGDGRVYSDYLSASLDASPLQVVSTYVNGVYVDTTGLVSALGLHRLGLPLEHEIGYGHLLVLFVLASLGCLALKGRFVSDEARHRSNALVIATWFSIMAPMSWYIIFKGHSAIHVHLNYVLWQMPFTLFGFAVVGLVLRELVVQPLAGLLSQRQQ